MQDIQSWPTKSTLTFHPNLTYQIQPNLPNQTWPTKPKLNLQNPTWPTKPNMTYRTNQAYLTQPNIPKPSWPTNQNLSNEIQSLNLNAKNDFTPPPPQYLIVDISDISYMQQEQNQVNYQD